jgi:hypothetical protein
MNLMLQQQNKIGSFLRIVQGRAGGFIQHFLPQKSNHLELRKNGGVTQLFRRSSKLKVQWRKMHHTN